MLRVCERAAACRLRRRRIHSTRGAARPLSSFPYSASPEVDSREVGVFWDFENCGVPSSLDPFLVRPNIERALRTSGFLGPISLSGYGNIHQISRAHVLEALSETGVDIHHVPNGGMNASDRALLIDVMLWTMKHPAPAHVLLISGDSDFSVLLHKLRLLSYNVLLAAPYKLGMSSVLVHAVSRVWVWPDIATGEGLLGQVHASGTPLPRVKDDVSKNKETRANKSNTDLREDMGLLSEYMKDVSEDGSKDLFSTSPEAGWIPSIVMNTIVNIVKGSPGISLGEISKELRLMNINPRAFGYPSYYHLLMSVRKLETRYTDGAGLKDKVRFYLVRVDNSDFRNAWSPSERVVGSEKAESNVSGTSSDKVCSNGDDKGLENSGEEKSPVTGTRLSWGSKFLRSLKGS